MTIGTRKEEKLDEKIGPGAYSPERADSQTKPKTSSVDLKKNSGRKSP